MANTLTRLVHMMMLLLLLLVRENVTAQRHSTVYHIPLIFHLARTSETGERYSSILLSVGSAFGTK